MYQSQLCLRRQPKQGRLQLVAACVNTVQPLLFFYLLLLLPTIFMYWPAQFQLSYIVTTMYQSCSFICGCGCVYSVQQDTTPLFLPAPTECPPSSCRHTQNAKHNTRPDLIDNHSHMRCQITWRMDFLNYNICLTIFNSSVINNYFTRVVLPW